MKMTIIDQKSIGEGLDFKGLESLGQLSIHDYTAYEDYEKVLQDTEILITNKGQLDRSILEKLPKLKLICVTGTGYNNVDLKACRTCGIGVCNVTGYSTDSVTQHTFAMLLNMMNRLSYYEAYTRQGTYLGDEEFSHYKVSYPALTGKRFGIIGMGAIGQKVAKVAGCFGCEVVYYSTSGKNHQEQYDQLDLRTLLETCDIVSVHAPLNDQTTVLINVQNIGLMKQGAYLLNLGRGAIIEEEAIVWALKNDWLSGIGLDVLEIEPMSDQSLLIDYLQHEKLLLTPHVAWANMETRQRVVDEVVANITSFIEGGNRHRVDLV